MAASFLFYDLETFGINPRQSRIAQFAAIRTDTDLNEVDEPISFFVKPANDVLPSPAATMVTGITPQYALGEGVNEAAAFARIMEEMARPETCSAGYNSLRFDDEFIRYGLYRNFYDPYEREWRGGNSRWDMLDALRMMHALRPEGVVWRPRDDGKGTSFKLEHLAEDNGLRIGDAHEALSDVRALIGMGRLFKRAQPKLWDYALRLRDKRFAASLLDTFAMTPVLHVSQRYSAERLSAAPVLPLAVHPQMATRVIAFDLSAEPDALLDMDAATIAERLYLRHDQLQPGQTRVPLKEIHTNKCPALVRWDHLREADFTRLGIDPTCVMARVERIRAAGPALTEKMRQVFVRERPLSINDVDAALYDGFIGDADKRLQAQVRGTPPHLLANAHFAFRDARLPELLFRYRARNWPEQLLPAELQRWDSYRKAHLLTPSAEVEGGLAHYQYEIERLRNEYTNAPEKLQLLEQLVQWGERMAAELKS